MSSYKWEGIAFERLKGTQYIILGTSSIMGDLGSVDLSETYKSALIQVAENEGLKDVSLEVTIGCMTGNNYVGRVYRARANGKRGNNAATLDLFLKTCAVESLRQNVPIEVLYKREIYTYTIVFQELQKVQEMANVDPRSQFTFVKCYYTSDAYLQEMLVLEDLKVQGFVMHDRFKSVNYSHGAMVMKTLGKLHALSYVLKAKKPDIFKQLTSNSLDVLFSGPFGDVIGGFFEVSAEQFLSVLEDPKDKVIMEKLTKDIMKKMRSVAVPGEHGVLAHGDCWINNMLFKYKKGVPVDMRLVDLQVMRYGSPAVDILYFIYSCTDEEFRTNHYHQMLDEYHSCLAACLREHSLDVDDFLTKQEFLNEIEKFSYYGLGVTIVGLRSFVTDSHEAIDLADVLEDTNNVKVAMPTGGGYQRFAERARGVARDYIKYALHRTTQ